MFTMICREKGSKKNRRWRRLKETASHGLDAMYSTKADASYIFTAAARGTLNISLWWADSMAPCNSVPVHIFDGDLYQTVYVNQIENGGQWNELDEFEFSGMVQVEIVSQGGCSTVADAIMMEKRE